MRRSFNSAFSSGSRRIRPRVDSLSLVRDVFHETYLICNDWRVFNLNSEEDDLVSGHHTDVYHSAEEILSRYEQIFLRPNLNNDFYEVTLERLMEELEALVANWPLTLNRVQIVRSGSPVGINAFDLLETNELIRRNRTQCSFLVRIRQQLRRLHVLENSNA